MPERVICRGISSSHYTQIPDQVFDELAPRLTEAELRVLLLICRHSTYTVAEVELVTGPVPFELHRSLVGTRLPVPDASKDR